MLFGLRALIKDAQTLVCLPQSSIFISSSLNQRSNVSGGEWGSTFELGSQQNTDKQLLLWGTWWYRRRHSSGYSNFYAAYFWLVSRESSLLASTEKAPRNMHLKAPDGKWNTLCWSFAWTIPFNGSNKRSLSQEFISPACPWRYQH